MAKAASEGSRSYMASLLSGILVAWLTSTTMRLSISRAATELGRVEVPVSTTSVTIPK